MNFFLAGMLTELSDDRGAFIYSSSSRQTLDPYNRTSQIKVKPEYLHEIAYQFIPLMIGQWRYVDQILTQSERDLLMSSGSASQLSHHFRLKELG